MKIIPCSIFNKFPQIKFGFSTKTGLSRTSPFFFNMSFTVGDNKERVIENRNSFYSVFGLKSGDVAFQKQTHSDRITFVKTGGFVGESDALITTEKNVGLAISSADCAAIFLYDPIKKVIAAVHSGWRGTQKKILEKTVEKLVSEFCCKPENIYAYLAPSISLKNYEVGEEVAALFFDKYVLNQNGKILLDIAGNNYDMLVLNGIPKENIEKSNLCSYENEFLHSYRRDGKESGRAFGLIVMKENN